jgi:hypothetical protein
MLYRAFVAHDGVFDIDVLVAGGPAPYRVWTWVKVTPLADPKTAA